MDTSRHASLAHQPLFQDLTEPELRFLRERAITLHLNPGQPVFLEGDPCEGLYMIESGQIKIFRTSPGGREQILTIEGAGASIAELPVFDDGNYPASASAITESTLLHIRKHDFQTLCLEHPEVALKVLKVVGSRLRRMVDLINELSFSSVRRRLASLLLRLAEDEGKGTPRGVAFNLPATNQELAAQIGTVRELVSRNLSRLQGMGMIQLDGKKVTITDLDALKAEAEDSDS